MIQEYSPLPEITSKLSVTGFAALQGVSDRERFLEVCNEIGTPFVHPDSSQDAITVLKYDKLKADAIGKSGFSTQHLELHTDRSTEQKPPSYIAMLYKSNSGSGGDALYVDGHDLYEELEQNSPAVLDWCLSPNAVEYNDGKLMYKGAIFNQLPNGKYQMRFRVDGCGFYNFSSMPYLNILLSTANKLAKIFRPKDNDMVIMDNYRWLHGRTKFSGNREVWRLLLNANNESNCGFSRRGISELIAS